MHAHRWMDDVAREKRPTTRTGKLPEQAPGPPSVASLLQLQRLAGNAAVTALLDSAARWPEPVVQRWIPKFVAYDSNELARAALDHRIGTNQLKGTDNAGALKDAHGLIPALSAGDDQHTEKVLIAGRVGWNDGDPPYANYRDPARGPAAIYTEREPCGGCKPILDQALLDDDIVYHTLPVDADRTMVTSEIAAARDWRRMRQELARRARMRGASSPGGAAASRQNGPAAVRQKEPVNGTCPVCRQRKKLSDGTLPVHYGKETVAETVPGRGHVEVRTRRRKCKGSGLPPARR